MPRGDRLTRQEWQTLKVQDFERLEAENERLRLALRDVERALSASPLVKPYNREREALEIIRAALQGAMSPGEPT